LAGATFNDGVSFRSLVGKSFASSAHKRTILFGLVVAPLFTIFGIAQALFVRHQTWATLRQEQIVWAKEIKDQIAYRDTWNLEGYRRASISAPAWDIVTSGGLVVDIEGFLPNFFPPARLLDDSIVRGPKTIATETGEKWRMLGKKLNGGILVVGSQSADDVGSLDKKLEENADRFGSSLIQATKTDSRNIDFDVDYVVLSDSGELVADWGGVPIKVDPGFVEGFSNGETKVALGSKHYAIFSTPILDSQGKPVGIILVPRDITFMEIALRNQRIFSFWTSMFLWVFVVLLSVLFVHGVIRRQHRLSSLKSALAQQKLEESHSIEFKRVFKWDFQSNQPNNELRLQFFLKPVAAFLNSEGGTLFIGVEDNGTVCGITEDLATFNGSPDKFEREMMGLIGAKIDPSYSRYIYVEFARIHGLNGPTVCMVDVLPAVRPAFVRWNGEVYFYKRAGRMSEPLDPKEQHEYIQDKWG
jgi:hypothetical protein